MNDAPSIQTGVFKKPFPEQVAFFRQKMGSLIPTAKWDDLKAAEHDRGFMVAGAQKSDLLADLANAVDDFIEQGKGIEDFRKQFKDIVAKNGWSGWTGSDTKKGVAWRTKVIYQTNSLTSYAAGRYAQLKRFKYWIYKHSDISKYPRPKHLSWNNLVLESGHRFWIFHYPPQGFGCHCYVVGTNSIKGAIRLAGDPNKTLPADWEAIDPKTGTPYGVDKGFDYAPGQSVLHHFDKHAATPDCLDFGATRLSKQTDTNCLRPKSGLRNWQDIGRPDLRNVDTKWKQQPPEVLNYGQDRSHALEILAAALGVSILEPTKVIDTPVEKAIIHYDLLEHMVEKQSDKRERYANFVIPTLENPFEIWNTLYDDSTRRRYIGLFEGKIDLLVSVRVNKDGSIFWNMMHSEHKKINRQRLGELIYAMDQKEK